MYQYDPEAYRQLHDEKAAELRSEFHRSQGQRRSKAAERYLWFARSVRRRRKLVTIGALLAALAVPATAAGQARARHARAQVICPQAVVILPGRGYGVCGGRFWVRDPENGQIATVPFWRMQRQNQRPDDHP